MSTLSRPAGPSWRAIVLVLAGVAAGAFLVGPALAGASQQAAIEASATARWASCPGLDFYPDRSGGVYGRGPTASGVVREADVNVVCGLSLPHGAKVTQVRFHLFDDDPSVDIVGCDVHRVRLDPPTGESQRLAGPKGTTGTPGYVVRIDSSIAFPTVNNRYYAYYAECNLSQGLYENPGVVGVTVRYTQ